MYSENIDFYKKVIRDFVSGGDLEVFCTDFCKKWREDRDEEFAYMKKHLEPAIISANPGISFIDMMTKVCDVLYVGCREEIRAVSAIFVLIDYYYPDEKPIRDEIVSKHAMMLD